MPVRILLSIGIMFGFCCSAAASGKAILGRGVNLGNALEAPQEGEWGMKVKPAYLALIAEAGFDSIRLPVRWSAHADEDSPYTISPAFFQRVDEAIQQAFEHELTVVLDLHHYDGLMEDPAPHRERFLALWAQVAEHYRASPPSLLFELLNEPNKNLDAETWNDLLMAAIRQIRVTNPERTLVVGPANWNAIKGLDSLTLPEDDRRIIVTFHYYLPFKFTHQGAGWVGPHTKEWVGTQWNGTADERLAIEADFDRAASWARKHRRPLYLGEFGVYEPADMDSRARWTEFVRRAAEERGMAWAYWEFGAGFGIYDRNGESWRTPLLRALLPAGKKDSE